MRAVFELAAISINVLMEANMLATEALAQPWTWFLHLAFKESLLGR